MEHLFWSGPRESDIFYTDGMFDASVTYYGSNQGFNSSFCGDREIRIDHNVYSEDASKYILEWQLQKIEEYPDCKFMSYNPNCLIGAPDVIIQHSLCLNDIDLMKQLNNKLEFREVAGDVVPLLPAKVLCGRECSFSNFSKMESLNQFNAYVIQELVASGGHGTFYLTAENEQEIMKFIANDSQYIVSGYVEDNIAVNVHAVIYDKDIVLLPGSIQVIQNNNNRLLYRGADFIAYRDISEEVILEFKRLSLLLSEKIQKLNYRGIFGIDAMIVDDNIYFLEINNRFQGSSIILNKALSEAGLPSLQRMNYDAFYSNYKKISQKDKLENLEVPYSLYTFINEMDSIHSNHIFSVIEKEREVSEVISEGYWPGQKTEKLATQFGVIFQINILGLCNNDKCVRLHPNIYAVSESWNKRILECDWTAVKISVMNRGVVISKEADRYIETHGQMRRGTYFSLDICLQGIYMNCPLYIKLASLSPFTIDINEAGNGICLKYYGVYLSDVEYDIENKFKIERLKGDIPINQICFLATDRLRLQNSAFCTFSEHHLSCSFCEADGVHNSFGEKEILEAIDTVFREDNIPFRHILIGGMSNHIGKERNTIINMCHRIRRYTDMPIYLMCLPPSPEDVDAYYHAGVNEFGFNLEIYDRELAKKYMPGKGYIPLEKYMKAFAEAVCCVGNKGAVRCAFIVGLEPETSLLEGIEAVCKCGVAPVLSVFRPIPGTKLQYMIPPSDEYLFALLGKAEEICNRYQLSLGPECPACRNNTLTFVKQNEIDELRTLGWRRKKV